MKGWAVGEDNKIYSVERYTWENYGRKNIFPTKEEAIACLALAQLCQLRDRYNDGWKPDWKDDNQFKWCIDFFQDVVRKTAVLFVRRTLTFKTEELRNKFLENFRDLIETAKPLL